MARIVMFTRDDRLRYLASSPEGVTPEDARLALMLSLQARSAPNLSLSTAEVETTETEIIGARTGPVTFELTQRLQQQVLIMEATAHRETPKKATRTVKQERNAQRRDQQRQMRQQMRQQRR